MGILSSLFGSASKSNNESIAKKYEFLFSPGEVIEASFRLVRDLLVFTNYRFIFIDIKGVTGKRVEYTSVPYRSIATFSVESSGIFSLDAELSIWVNGCPNPIHKKFNRDSNVYQVQAILATAVANLDNLR